MANKGLVNMLMTSWDEGGNMVLFWGIINLSNKLSILVAIKTEVCD